MLQGLELVCVCVDTVSHTHKTQSNQVVLSEMRQKHRFLGQNRGVYLFTFQMFLQAAGASLIVIETFLS